MSEMIVQVRNKMLRRIGGVNHFVSHNKDYTIQFQFDESWDNVRTKMAVFAYEDGEYGSEIFDGDVCGVPELPREGRIYIGLKAGSELASELLCVQVCESADDVITDEYDEPDPKIYEEILDILNNLWGGGDTVYPSSDDYLVAPDIAKPGQIIRVKELDADGDIKKTEAIDLVKDISDDSTNNEIASAKAVYDKIKAAGAIAVDDEMKIDSDNPASGRAVWFVINNVINLLRELISTKQPLGDYIEIEEDPTVPRWAKQPKKPKYNASEVGAVAKAQGVKSSGKFLGVNKKGYVEAMDISASLFVDEYALAQKVLEIIRENSDSEYKEMDFDCSDTDDAM